MSSDLRTAIIENITIADFLRSEGYEVIPRGRKLTVKGHDSLVITPDKNVFTWNSRGFGGSVIDLYMGLHSCDARTAMIELRKQLPEYKKERPKPNQPHPAKPPAPKDKESVPLILPTEDKNKWRRVYAYLISTRKITPTIVKWLVQEKTIYPDERGNLCYLGRDGKGGINYCARKGTLTPRNGQKGYRKAFPSFSHMATVLHMAIGTVQTAIKSLVAAGRLLKAAFRAGKHNLYMLVETVVQALPGVNPDAQKENRRAGTRRQKVEMLLASIASLISNFTILQEIGACQEVLQIFVKGVCQNLRNSNKTNPTYSTEERYFSPQKSVLWGEVRLNRAFRTPAEISIGGSVPIVLKNRLWEPLQLRSCRPRCRSSRLFFLCTVVATDGSVRYNLSNGE